MTEKNQLEVNEERLMQLMAADVPLSAVQKTQPSEEVVKAQTTDDESEPVREETVKPAKRKNVRQIDFEGIFLKEAKIKDRRQMYISGEYYDKISAYLRIISDGKVSMVGYIHNVLAHHVTEFKDMINEMYKDKLNKINPL